MTSDAHGAQDVHGARDAYDSLPDAVAEIFGEGATAELAYDLLTVDVPAASWLTALETARDRLGCTYFDWLSAVDEPGTGFRVAAHVASVRPRAVRRLLVRTTVPHEAAELPTALGVYAGAGWRMVICPVRVRRPPLVIRRGWRRSPRRGCRISGVVGNGFSDSLRRAMCSGRRRSTIEV